MTSPLASASVVLDGNGAGIVSVGPTVYGTVWTVTRLITSCTASPVSLNVYRQTVTPGNLVDSTKRGDGAASETHMTLNSGDVLIASYSGGPVGAVATFNIEGDQTR